MSKLFPEIGDRASHTEPGGRRACGSAWSRDALARMLGLPGPFTAEPPVSVRAVEVDLEAGIIHVTIEGGGLPETTLRLQRRRPQRAGGADIAVELAGPPSGEAARALMRHAEQRLATTRHGQLRAFLQLDPHRRVEGRRDESSARMEAQFQRSVVRTYRSPVAWREFFADVEQQRNFTHNPVGHVVFVDHADLECVGASPRIGDGAVSFFRYAAVHHSPTRGGWFPDLRLDLGDLARLLDEDGGGYVTDLDDDAVIHGGGPRLEQVLARVAALPRRPDLVLLRNSCVPKVIGDDLEAIARAFERDSGIPTAIVDELEDQHASPLSALLRRQQQTGGFDGTGFTANRLNLVGYPRSPPMLGLASLLSQLGLVVNAQLVPDVQLEFVDRYTRAALQVLQDAQLFDATFEQLFGNVDIPTLRPPSPFGPAGCQEWLRVIAGAMGVAEGVAAVWSAAWSEHAAEWARLRERAREHCLGFVVDRDRLAALRAPRQLTGVPVLDAVVEMGFQVELLCFDDGAPAPAELAEPGWRVATFSTAAELAEALRSGTAEAVYSEYTFDPRLTRCGKAAFSVADFGPGPAGAVGTLRTLVRRCRLPFYRKYGALMEDR